MGDCSSRPKPEQIVEHESLSLSKHDDQFYRSPDLSFASDIEHMEAIKTQEDLDSARDLRGKLKEYRAWMDQYELFLTKRLVDKTWESVKRVIVEVKKGRDLHYPHTCINEVSLYVRLKLEPRMPQGKELVTSMSRNDIPVWGRCFGLNMSRDYTTLYLTVLVHRKRFSEVEFGTVTIKLRTLANQKVVENWFPVVTPFTDNERPSVFLRIQYITDERALIEDCRAACLTVKSEEARLRSKLDRLIQRAEDNIEPAGRG